MLIKLWKKRIWPFMREVWAEPIFPLLLPPKPEPEHWVPRVSLESRLDLASLHPDWPKDDRGDLLLDVQGNPIQPNGFYSTNYLSNDPRSPFFNARYVRKTEDGQWYAERLGSRTEPIIAYPKGIKYLGRVPDPHAVYAQNMSPADLLSHLEVFRREYEEARDFVTSRIKK